MLILTWTATKMLFILPSLDHTDDMEVADSTGGGELSRNERQISNFKKKALFESWASTIYTI